MGQTPQSGAEHGPNPTTGNCLAWAKPHHQLFSMGQTPSPAGEGRTNWTSCPLLSSLQTHTLIHLSCEYSKLNFFSSDTHSKDSTAQHSWCVLGAFWKPKGIPVQCRGPRGEAGPAHQRAPLSAQRFSVPRSPFCLVGARPTMQGAAVTQRKPSGDACLSKKYLSLPACLETVQILHKLCRFECSLKAIIN